MQGANYIRCKYKFTSTGGTMKRHISICIAFFFVFAASTVLANHHAIKTASKDGIGNYLTDAEGKTLYWFKKDSENKSVCSGGCLEKWPIYYRKSVAVSPGIDSKDFGTIARVDGQKQTTFRGYPLYYFVNDKAAGETTGQKVKDVWFVIDPANFPPE